MNQIAALTNETPQQARTQGPSVPATAANRPAPPPAQFQAPAPGSLIEAIFQMAARPDLDMDRFGQLMEWQEKLEARQARKAYFDAMALLQKELPTVDAKGAIVIHHKDDANKPVEQRRIIQSTKYARWEDINDALRGPLAAHGFALTFKADREADRVIVTGILSHREGHSEQTVLPLAIDTTGSKNNVQAVGSSIAYGKRYTAGMLLNFTSRAEADRDDDGKGAGELDARSDRITPDQLAQLRQEIDAHGVDEAKFCAFMLIDRLEDMPVAMLEPGLAHVRRRKPAPARS